MIAFDVKYELLSNVHKLTKGAIWWKIDKFCQPLFLRPFEVPGMPPACALVSLAEGRSGTGLFPEKMDLLPLVGIFASVDVRWTGAPFGIAAPSPEISDLAVASPVSPIPAPVAGKAAWTAAARGDAQGHDGGSLLRGLRHRFCIALIPGYPEILAERARMGISRVRCQQLNTNVATE